MKLRTERGFGGVEALLVIVIIGALGVVGYWVYSQNHKKASVASTSSGTSSASSQTPKADGTTQSVDELTKQDANSEGAIDSKYENSEQSTAQSANQAAKNVGGAYDESTL